MRVVFPTALLFVLLLLTGCAGAQLAQKDAAIDSLHVVNRQLHAQVYALQDSILFFQDIDSGQYYRDRGALRDSIDRLNYLLAEQTSPLPRPALATLQVDALFEPASATLTEAGQATLAAFTDTLRTITGRIRVEGHADNVPVSGRLQEKYPSNWELSAARAAAVVRFFTEQDLPPARFEVVSFGDTKPSASNASASGRRENRRIHIVVVPW